MSSDGYATLRELVALLADSKATLKRIDQLQKFESEIAKEQAKLDADRATHDRAVAAAEAEMIAREAALRKREVEVSIHERDLAAREKVIADARPPRYPSDPESVRFDSPGALHQWLKSRPPHRRRAIPLRPVP